MVDETTDITTFQQYITFVQYVNARGEQSTAFLDIHQIDAHGASAVNLFRPWNEIAFEVTFDLDGSKHVALEHLHNAVSKREL